MMGDAAEVLPMSARKGTSVWNIRWAIVVRNWSSWSEYSTGQNGLLSLSILMKKRGFEPHLKRPCQWNRCCRINFHAGLKIFFPYSLVLGLRHSFLQWLQWTWYYVDKAAHTNLNKEQFDKLLQPLGTFSTIKVRYNSHAVPTALRGRSSKPR